MNRFNWLCVITQIQLNIKFDYFLKKRELVSKNKQKSHYIPLERNSFEMIIKKYDLKI